MTGDGSGISIAADGGVSFNFFSSFLLPASETDAQGTPIPGFIVALSSSDTSVAQTGAFGGFAFIVPQKPGHATIIASGTAYGVSLADTVTYTITMPTFQAVRIQPGTVTLGGPTQVGFHSADVTVQPGGTVLWINLSGQAVDVVFDDPTNVLEHGPVTDCAGQPEPPGGGNIAAFGVPQDPQAAALDPQNCRSRRFPVAGTYPYHSTVTGAKGRIVVNDGLSGS
jgi:plastocyanin